MVDLSLFRADHPPATLRLHAAHGGHAIWHTPAKAIAMRHLIETIRCSNRAKFDRLEQNIVT